MKREKETREWLKKERSRIMRPWRVAIIKLRVHQYEQCALKRSEDARFQDGAMVKFLTEEIRAVGDDIAAATMHSYWLFVGSPWAEELGSNAAQTMHSKEMDIYGISGPFEWAEHDDRHKKVEELLFRLSSLAAWIEAQEGYIIWCDLSKFRKHRASEYSYQRSRDSAAVMLAELGKGWDLSNEAFSAFWLGGELGRKHGTGLISDCDIKNSKQWAELLRKAADLAEESIRITEQERWIWWMNPVFRRYKWSASQVFEAIEERFGECAETKGDVARFQAKWIRRGIRFTGKKGRQQEPKIRRFVLDTEIPDRDENPRYTLWR